MSLLLKITLSVLIVLFINGCVGVGVSIKNQDVFKPLTRAPQSWCYIEV